MEFLARLVHADATTRIVEVQALEAGRLLGSALGEAATAEVAEARALERLRNRLGAADGPKAAVTAPVGAAGAVADGQGMERGRAAARTGSAPGAAAGPRQDAGLMPTLPLRPQRPAAGQAPGPGQPGGAATGREAGDGPLPPQLRPSPAGKGAAGEPGAADAVAITSGAAAGASTAASIQADGRPVDLRPTDLREDAGQAPEPGERPPQATAEPAPEGAAIGAADPQPQSEEPPADPEDWSEELARLDLALRRLGWTRESEASYLQRAFGHPSRSRLTSYADLVAYLRQVEALEPGADPATTPVPLRRRDLISQGDQLLEQLGWDTEEARRFIRDQMLVASRSQLNDEQLLRFNMQLEAELLARMAGGAEST